MEDLNELTIKLEVLKKQFNKVRDTLEERKKEIEIREKMEYESKLSHNVFKIGQFVRSGKKIVKVTEILDKGYFMGIGFDISWGNWEYRNRKCKCDDYEVVKESFYEKNHILQIELTPSEMMELKIDFQNKTHFADSTYEKIFEWICETENKNGIEK